MTAERGPTNATTHHHKHRLHAALLTVPAFALAACGIVYSTPSVRARDARFGHLAGAAPPPEHDALCRDWDGALADRDHYARFHSSFPETDPTVSCYTPVTFTDRALEVGATPSGCGYPNDEQVSRLRALADRVDAWSQDPSGPVSELFPCEMTDEDRLAAARQNARVLRATAERASRPDARSYPYASVITFGYGWRDQTGTSIAHWRPGDACRPVTNDDLAALGIMPLRARRVADALHAGVAPTAIVSGGTFHSSMVEAFALMYLLQCYLDVRPDQVLVEACAEHTHTNLRNSGRWLVSMGARTGYIVTDQYMQGNYLQDFGGFELLFGSIDQRSMRDWHYLLGSWRTAANGPNVGFWYSPYRFWAEPRDGAGSLTCLDNAERPGGNPPAR